VGRDHSENVGKPPLDESGKDLVNEDGEKKMRARRVATDGEHWNDSHPARALHAFAQELRRASLLCRVEASRVSSWRRAHER
jgi:hypothetical protein